MSACRMGYDLMTKQGRKNFKESIFRWHRLPPYVWGDTIGPIVCKIMSCHDLYLNEDVYACRRCHRFISEKEIEEMQCPVCGYYCLGKGGNGCINKPSLINKEAK